MKPKITLFRMLASALMLFALLAGCATAKKAAVIRPEPTCSEALAGGVNQLSDNELADLLDRADSDGTAEACWIPLMHHALGANRDIPQRHLLKAVKVFNQNRYADYFHKAVYRYLLALTKAPGQYRSEDRRLLETYCSYLINSAETRTDDHLDDAKLLCRRLDPDLYAKFFK